MFSAVWGSALLALLSLWVGISAAAAALFSANLALALGHSWSTTWMVIGSPLLREERRRNRRKYTWIPLIIVAASVALGLSVSETRAIPKSVPLNASHWLWALYLGVFWVGHFWHFGNQDFGVLSIYRLKAGQVGRRDRRIDKAYAAGMMFVIQPFVYLKAVSKSPLSEAFFSYSPLGPEFVAAAATASVVLAGIATATVMGLELRKPDRSFPKLAYYAVMLSHPTVLYLLQYRLGFFYLIAYFWSHWLIAIGLVGRINTNFHRERGLGPLRSIGRHLTELGFILLLVSPLYVFFSQLSVFSGSDYKEVLAAVGPDYSTLLGIVLGLFLAEQLLHYYCDRCLFRFRDPGIRKCVAPLL